MYKPNSFFISLSPILPVLVCTVVFAAAGCKKPDPVVLEVDDDFLEYCWFPEGNRWIYQEQSDSNLVDTVKITYKNFTNAPLEEYDHEFELYVFDYEVRGEPFSVTIYPDHLPEEPKRLLYKESDNNGAWSVHFFRSERDTLTIDFAKTYFAFYQDGITVAGIFYPDAIKVVHAASAFGNPTRSIVFAKNVGIVQREFWDGTIWDLVEHY
jgi:hypothetical protein